MKIRVLTIALLAIFALGISAVAKDRPVQSGKAGIHQNAVGEKGLGLTADQKTKIQTILQKYRTDVRDAIKSNLTKDEKKAKIQSLHEQAKADIMALLTPDQQQKAQQSGIIDKMLSPGGEREMRLMMVLKQLNLTDQQKAAVKDIFAKTKDQAKAIQDDTTLDQAAKRAKLAELRKATLTQVQQLLTPEQTAKLQELLKDRSAPTK